jgi:hypothetical protein
MTDKGNDRKSALAAKFDAQKIAFAPIMFQAALAMRNLNILQVIHESRDDGMTIAEVAEKTGVSEYGVKVLLEAGLSLEIVMVRDERFRITKTGWFLLNDPLTRVNMDFTQDVNYLGFFHLEDAIRTGKPEGLKAFGSWDTIYEALSQLPEKAQRSWFAFDHYYSDHAFPQVMPYLFADKPARILDVGGNTGKFSIFTALHNADVRITILDLPGQLEKAHRNIREAGLDDRIDSVAINLLDHRIAYPGDYDAVWMSQFLDCFCKPDIVKLLEKARDALAADGSVFILETLWDRQKYEASTYSLHATSLYFTCLANGCSQMYHADDMYELISQAGLRVQQEWDNIGLGHTLMKCKKA